MISEILGIFPRAVFRIVEITLFKMAGHVFRFTIKQTSSATIFFKRIDCPGFQIKFLNYFFYL